MRPFFQTSRSQRDGNSSKGTGMETKTDWESSSGWYDRIVGTKGHYYHENVILPKVKTFLKLGPGHDPSVLDLACGQGVLSRHLPKGMRYLGVDGSPSLITAAKRYTSQPSHTFLVCDLSTPAEFPHQTFSHATILLAVQNIADPTALFQTAFSHLRKEGLCLIVMNHPCFRIPRQSSWGIDTTKKWQYRRIDRYFSPLKIPIQTHPGQGETSEQTLSFHHPLSFFIQKLTQTGFVLTGLEEWCSDKCSQGKYATMENKSRQEFPLFLSLTCKKLK